MLLIVDRNVLKTKKTVFKPYVTRTWSDDVIHHQNIPFQSRKSWLMMSYLGNIVKDIQYL